MEQYIEQLTNLQLRTKFLIGLILLLCSGYYSYNDQISGAKDGLIAAKQESDNLDEQLNKAINSGISLPTLEAKQKKAEADFAALLEVVPSDFEIEKLLTSVADSAHEAGVELKKFQPQGVAGVAANAMLANTMPAGTGISLKDLVSQKLIKLQFEGTYSQVVRFMDKMMSLPRAFKLGVFKFSPQGYDGGSNTQSEVNQSVNAQAKQTSSMKISTDGLPVLLVDTDLYIFAQTASNSVRTNNVVAPAAVPDVAPEAAPAVAPEGGQ